MESLGISHQTLREFIDSPFGIPNKQKNLKYEDKYQSYRKANKIRIESSILFEDNYFIHVKVPSESQKGQTYYDVVVQFFTSDDKVKRELSVENYYVQFFSNSPGFVYKYAALYKLQGYLIETLYDKFDTGILDILPDKSNKTYELYFDSSIYYACRYLLDNKIFTLGKLNIRIFKTKKPETFFGDIQDFASVNASRDMVSLQNKLKKEIEKDTKLSEQQEAKLKKASPKFAKEINDKHEIIRAKKSTFQDSSNNSKKITSKKTTSNTISIKRISGNAKKKSSKRTTKSPKK
jgi:hypothetical protein